MQRLQNTQLAGKRQTVVALGEPRRRLNNQTEKAIAFAEDNARRLQLLERGSDGRHFAAQPAGESLGVGR